jgi:hypothetical protein
MSRRINPFEYEQATTLAPDFVRDVFIEDHNFTRFIQSNRNVFLIGERGSGKSMTLLYNSIAVQRLRAEANEIFKDFEYLGIYVPCNTTLFHKKEHELVEDQELAAIISEHFMVVGIAFAIAKGVGPLLGEIASSDEGRLREELVYVLGADLLTSIPLMEALEIYLQRQARSSQEFLNALRLDEFRKQAFTFSSLIHPLLTSLRRNPGFTKKHFLILIDDAHDLNSHQMQALNSWIGYRDRSHFSFKVAVADSLKYSYRTASGGAILEGHDFLTIDLQRPFQSPGSDFGRLAKDVVERRLSKIDIHVPAELFFPPSSDFQSSLEICRQATQEEADAKYPNPEDAKQRRDYVYKYARVRYFRERDPKANLPPYSGFETLTHVSTGVIRNLLRPCYWMYDDAYSTLPPEKRDEPMSFIPPEVQSRVIRDQSEKLWKWIESSLQSSIDDCSLEDARHVFQLFDNLANLFRERLLKANAEPRALAFSISAMTDEYQPKIGRLLAIARRAQILYFRSGPAKDDGRRETYYVPNRMLWPIRGLDVVGQHARVSLRARDIWAAAAENRQFPFAEADKNQGDLFNVEA